MAKPAKRDGDYFLGRLEREQPTVYADYLAGKFGCSASTARPGSLRKPRTALHEFKPARSIAVDRRLSPGER